MAINTKFEAYKVRRELKRSGKSYEFYRTAKNDIGEPVIGLEESVGSMSCIYHELNNPIIVLMNDTTLVRNPRNTTGKQSMLLCIYDDVIAMGLGIGDICKINEKDFKVSGVVNIQEWNIIADISLEVIDDGHNISL